MAPDTCCSTLVVLLATEYCLVMLDAPCARRRDRRCCCWPLVEVVVVIGDCLLIELRALIVIGGLLLCFEFVRLFCQLGGLDASIMIHEMNSKATLVDQIYPIRLALFDWMRDWMCHVPCCLSHDT